jgi:hypothetical protein
MSTTALIMMICAWAIILYFTIRFFVKVVKTPPRPEPDSYSGNDDVKR